MEFIKRFAYEKLKASVKPGKVALLYGPRRAGKTTLLEKLVEEQGKKEVLFVSGEDVLVQKSLSSQSIKTLRDFIGESKVLIVDEAHTIPQIGLNLKLIVDNIKGVAVVASGSASLALAQDISEPLVGRKTEIMLYPLWAKEITAETKNYDLLSNIDDFLVYGSYPEVVTSKNRDSKQQYLMSLLGGYLFKDILAFEGVRGSDTLLKLLNLLAFQIGGQVSVAELASSLGISHGLVSRYLDLFEKAFVIKRVGGFSRNLRKEIAKTSRWYFYDNGVRNAVIQNFSPVDVRGDVGPLWENYIFMERLKKAQYTGNFANRYFWRTYDKKEIDLVEEKEGKLFGFEIKYSPKKINPPSDWFEAYPNASFEVISRDNFLSFII